MYEFIVLAQLMHGPAHGYLIAKIINDMIGPYARISYGRLYPLLAKLEQNGLIAVDETQSAGQGDRQLRIYKITDAGRLRFRILMNDTGSNPGDYQRLFLYKVAAFSFITPAERLRIIDHYINYCQSHVFFQQNEAEDMVSHQGVVEGLVQDAPQLAHGIPRVNASSLSYILKTMEHSISQWQAELDWARGLREQELTLAQKMGNGLAAAAATGDHREKNP
ncbi:MAG TPA: PadR family transcriptional regulator [Ktedonobacteraceae bacterium]|nr:PadR family transcriptional regulator [Ktedonobacteraceae bacterium]